MAGSHFIEHGTEGPDVGADVGFFAFEQFGGHVLRGAHDGAFGGEDLCEGGVGGAGLGDGLGEAEIEEFDAVAGEDDVLRFDVAVGDAGAVGAVEGVGDLGGVFEGLVEGEGAFFDALGEGFAFHELHDHVAGAGLVADVVEGTDVGVVEAGDGAGFAFEAGAEVFALGDVVGEDFDGDGAVETGVFGFVDFAHAAGSNGGDDFS